MDYKVDVLTPCEFEELEAVIVCAAIEAFMQEEQGAGKNLLNRSFKQSNTNLTAWNIIGKSERFFGKL